jgi:TonB family protein
MKTIRLVLLSICLAACATTRDLPAEPVARCEGLTPFPEGVEQPRKLHAPQPKAPRGGPVSGYVCLEVTIDTEGRVLDPQVLGTNSPEFAANLVRAVGDWRFAPATRDGLPVAVPYSLVSEYHRMVMR